MRRQARLIKKSATLAAGYAGYRVSAGCIEPLYRSNPVEDAMIAYLDAKAAGYDVSEIDGWAITAQPQLTAPVRLYKKVKKSDRMLPTDDWDGDTSE